jgi:hypothetical protein
VSAIYEGSRLVLEERKGEESSGISNPQPTHHEFNQYKRCRSILGGIVVDATSTNGHELCRDVGTVMLIDP